MGQRLSAFTFNWHTKLHPLSLDFYSSVSVSLILTLRAIPTEEDYSSIGLHQGSKF